MRGVETRIQEIRHKIFTEVARMAYHTEWPVKERMEALPYKIIPGEKGNFRNDVFLERAIVGERLVWQWVCLIAVLQSIHSISDGIEAADKDETYYTPPLINVIKFACNACPEKEYMLQTAVRDVWLIHAWRYVQRCHIAGSHNRKIYN